MAVITGLVLGILVIVGVRFWYAYQTRQAQGASHFYSQMELALTINDTVLAKTRGQAVLDEYPSTAYAELAALKLAKLAVDAGEMEAAAQYLQEVIATSSETGIVAIAKLRLARVFLQLEKLDEAYKLVSKDGKGSLASAYAEVRGDILARRGDKALARESYRLALAGAADEPQRQTFITMKLDELAIATPTEGAAP